MAEEMKKKLQTTQRRMMRMIIQTKRQAGKSCAAARAASVDVTADVGPTTPTVHWGTTRLSTTTKTSTSTKKSSHNADSNPCFDEIPEDNPEDELEPWVDCLTRASRKADDLIAANKQNHVVESQAEPDLLESGKDDCQAPRRPLERTRLQLEPSNINQAERAPQTRKTSQEMGGRPQHQLTTRQNPQWKVNYKQQT